MLPSAPQKGTEMYANLSIEQLFEKRDSLLELIHNTKSDTVLNGAQCLLFNVNQELSKRPEFQDYLLVAYGIDWQSWNNIISCFVDS